MPRQPPHERAAGMCEWRHEDYRCPRRVTHTRMYGNYCTNCAGVAWVEMTTRDRERYLAHAVKRQEEIAAVAIATACQEARCEALREALEAAPAAAPPTPRADDSDPLAASRQAAARLAEAGRRVQERAMAVALAEERMKEREAALSARSALERGAVREAELAARQRVMAESARRADSARAERERIQERVEAFFKRQLEEALREQKRQLYVEFEARIGPRILEERTRAIVEYERDREMTVAAHLLNAAHAVKEKIISRRN